MPGDTVGNFGSALHLLSDRATYLYSDGDRYWYDISASVSRIARDYADRLRERPDDTWAEIVRRLTEHELRARGAFARVHIGSEDTGDIPDDAAARLVIVHPRYRHSRGDEASTAMMFARRALETRGSSQRVNRNMVVFLAPDARRMEELEEAAREYLAWRSIAASEERIRELDLSAQQAAQARNRLKGTDQTVSLRIACAYHWLLVPVQPQPDRPIGWEVHRADGARERLAERASDKLCQADLLRIVHGARSIRYDLDNRLASAVTTYLRRFDSLGGYCGRRPVVIMTLPSASGTSQVKISNTRPPGRSPGVRPLAALPGLVLAQRGFVTDEPDVAERVGEATLPVNAPWPLVIADLVGAAVRPGCNGMFDEAVWIVHEHLDAHGPGAGGCRGVPAVVRWFAQEERCARNGQSDHAAYVP